ncbi:MAG: hypothetical protein ACFHHU_14315 [Porticoccaceae bacterium]
MLCVHGMTLEEVHQLTHIDPWFLIQIRRSGRDLKSML